MSAATLENITSEIIELVKSKFPLAAKRGLKPSTPLLESGIVDSVGVLDLVIVLERQYGITISDDELTPETFHNAESVAQFVVGKRA